MCWKILSSFENEIRCSCYFLPIKAKCVWLCCIKLTLLLLKCLWNIWIKWPSFSWSPSFRSICTAANVIMYLFLRFAIIQRKLASGFTEVGIGNIHSKKIIVSVDGILRDYGFLMPHLMFKLTMCSWFLYVSWTVVWFLQWLPVLLGGGMIAGWRECICAFSSPECHLKASSLAAPIFQMKSIKKKAPDLRTMTSTLLEGPVNISFISAHNSVMACFLWEVRDWSDFISNF